MIVIKAYDSLDQNCFYDDTAMRKARDKGLTDGSKLRLSLKLRKGRRKLVKVEIVYGGLYGGCDNPDCCSQGYYFERVTPLCRKPAA